MEHFTEIHGYSTPAGYLGQATRALLFILDTRATGRLSLRNSERFGILHLYFQAARLIHVAGNKQSAECLLQDLLTWTKGDIRFDVELVVPYETLTWQQAQIFGRWLAFLEMRGLMQGIERGHLQGLAQHLTAYLPGEPIELPEEVENYEEYNEAARARQWQRLNEGTQQLIQSVQETVELIKQTVGQRVEHAVSQATTQLPPELQARSIRYRRVLQASSQASSSLLDKQ